MSQRLESWSSEQPVPEPAAGTLPAGSGPLLGTNAAWNLLLAARAAIAAGGVGSRLGLVAREPGLPPAAITLDLSSGRCAAGRHRFNAAACELLDLFLDLAIRPAGRRQVVAMLGQSLDGYIATHGGDSHYVNDQPSLAHQHRLRALSDAVLIGASTAVLDRPRLTTRHVEGPHPVRVVVDPNRRLPAGHGLLCDGAARTMIVRRAERVAAEIEIRRLTDQAAELLVPARDGQLCPRAVLQALAEHGLTRLMVEGGGITVTRFLESGMLDRLQLAVAPLILGRGRPAIDLPAVERLGQGLRPRTRVFRMGCDVLFDMMLRETAAEE